MEPDDRASHRGGPKSGNRPDRGPAAAGQQGPYDHQDPPKRDRSQSDSGKAEKPNEPEKPAEPKKPSEPKKPAEAKQASETPAEAKQASDRSQPDSSKSKKPKRSKTDDAEVRRPKPVAAKAEKPKADDSKRGRDEHVHMPSNVDARGEDKYRKVIGQHNPNRAKQFLYYGIFIAFIVVAYLGLSAAVDRLDKAPAHDPASAPWAQPGAPQGPLGGFEPRKQGQKGPTHFQ
jgi:hypothetical protein